MTEAQKKLTVEEQRKQEEYNACKAKLESIGISKETLKVMPQADVITMAKTLVTAEHDRDEALLKEQETAKKNMLAFRKTAKSVLPDTCKALEPAIKSAIENKPSLPFTKSYKDNDGTLSITLTAFQDVERPEVKDITSAKEKVQDELDRIVKAFGKRNLKQVMKVEKGSGSGKSFSVLPSNRGQDLTDFQKIPVEVGNYRYNLSVKWIDKKDETED